MPEYFQLPARRLLNRCNGKCLPFQRTINPYRGCELGCVYCYARYTHEFLDLDGVRDFETKIFAKQFFASAFRAELAKADRQEAIAIGTATDPYQPAERRFSVTRQILTVFAGEQGRRLSMTTKSDLVLRDLDLFGKIARANFLHINITITTLNARLARRLEPRAPRPDLRLGVVRELARAGLEVGVFPNPILPLLTDSEESLDALGAAAAHAGASFMGDGLLFLRPPADQVVFAFFEQHFPRLVPKYRQQFRGRSRLGGEYPKLIQERVRKIRARYGLAGAPAGHPPELWPCEPQGELFPQSTIHNLHNLCCNSKVMNRRTFAVSAAGASLAGAAQPAAAKNAIFELRYYRLRNGAQVQRTQEFLGKVFFPAAQRAGIGPMGFFSAVIAADAPFVLCLLSYPSLAAMDAALAKLAADKEYAGASEEYNAVSEMNFIRMESSLLRAFDTVPQIEMPPSEGKRPARVFELRTYESNNLKTLKRKIKMFDDTEIAIFRRCGLLPVFFGETLIGRNLPKLTYMVAYDDMAARDKAWRAFGADPEWQKLRGQPELADALIVSNISNAILRPLGFSPIR